MKVYREMLGDDGLGFEMVPIPSGTFLMGSPDDEADRSQDEGPQHEVAIGPFWIGRCEVTWDEYNLWAGVVEGLAADDTGDAGADGLQKSMETGAYEWLRTQATKARLSSEEVILQVRTGNASLEIVAAAEEHHADLVVIGGDSPLGRVARSVFESSSCSVLMVERDH